MLFISGRRNPKGSKLLALQRNYSPLYHRNIGFSCLYFKASPFIIWTCIGGKLDLFFPDMEYKPLEVWFIEPLDG